MPGASTPATEENTLDLGSGALLVSDRVTFFGSYLPLKTEMPKPTHEGAATVATLVGGGGQNKQKKHVHITHRKRSLVVMSWKAFCACALRRRGPVSAITDSGGWNTGLVFVTERLRRVLTT